MATDRRDDRALLAATRDRDGLAFAEFYRRHRGLVLRFVRQRVRSTEVAADLLAETSPPHSRRCWILKVLCPRIRSRNWSEWRTTS
jgi:hypothetical protein